ncbi:hypothetical protein H0H92_009206 [Tricholoma furcatifolium]|nr:hypothetical protein H0H92_009206 [Tricholoma furcatifolium]
MPGHGHIPRPRNAFILFCTEYKANRIRGDGASFGEKSKAAGAAWRALPDSELEKYYEMAEEEKSKHQLMYPGYAYQPKTKQKKEEEKALKVQEKEAAEQRKRQEKQKAIRRAIAKQKNRTKKNPYPASDLLYSVTAPSPYSGSSGASTSSSYPSGNPSGSSRSLHPHSLVEERSPLFEHEIVITSIEHNLSTYVGNGWDSYQPQIFDDPVNVSGPGASTFDPFGFAGDKASASGSSESTGDASTFNRPFEDWYNTPAGVQYSSLVNEW